MLSKLRSRLGPPSPATVIAVIALIVAFSGVSKATVPDSGGMIHACVTVANGTLRIIDTEATPPQVCHTGEYLLSWNKEGREGDEGDEGDRGHHGRKGEEGDQGPAGPTGPTGPPGAAG